MLRVREAKQQMFIEIRMPRTMSVARVERRRVHNSGSLFDDRGGLLVQMGLGLNGQGLGVALAPRVQLLVAGAGTPGSHIFGTPV